MPEGTGEVALLVSVGADFRGFVGMTTGVAGFTSLKAWFLRGLDLSVVGDLRGDLAGDLIGGDLILLGDLMGDLSGD